MTDPFGQNKGPFRYGAILRSIRRIAVMVETSNTISAGPPQSEAMSAGATSAGVESGSSSAAAKS